MTAEEKMLELGGQQFYAHFMASMQAQTVGPYLEWLGFGRKKTGCLAIEANLTNAPLRFSFKFSLSEGSTMCCINLRARTEEFDGGNYADYRDAFIHAVNKALLHQENGPHSGIRLMNGDAYFKPFGALRNTHQRDVFFDATNVHLPADVEPCAVSPVFAEMSLQQAVQRTLNWLNS